MNYLEVWVHSPLAPALGSAIVHSLWQGALIVALLAGTLAAVRSPRARYTAGCLALLALFASFCATFAWQLDHPVPALVTTRILHLPPAPDPANQPFDQLPAPFRAQDYLPWLAPLWIAGVLFFQLRSLAAWWSARRLRGRGVCAAPPVWRARLCELARRLAVGRPVVLLESALAEVPVVIGYLRPVILMPVGLLAGLPAEQVEGILLHELAHIRRHDYLVNLLQILVESMLFYHPAAWWISGLVRAEREHCCDDLAVATQGSALSYATALTALEANRGAMRTTALAATGGSLMKRIHRLLMQPEGPRATPTPIVSAALLTIGAAVVLAAWQTPAPPPPLPPPPPPVQMAQAPQAPQAPVPPVAPSGIPARRLAPVPPTPPGVAPIQADPPSLLPADWPYQKWLTQDVAYIITNAERAAFKGLQSNEEREKFIEQFWARRDPTPGTPLNEFKAEHYRRIAYTNDQYSTPALPGWKTDRGRIYIVYGPPNEKESHSAGSAYRQPGTSTLVKAAYERWMYRWIEGVGTNVIVEFVDQNNDGIYRMTMDPNQEPPTTEATKKYYVQGEVVRPGDYTLAEPTRVLEALVKAGGFKDFANQKKIEIMRLTGERLDFNYKEVIQGRNMSQNVLLQPGDIIVVH